MPYLQYRRKYVTLTKQLPAPVLSIHTFVNYKSQMTCSFVVNIQTVSTILLANSSVANSPTFLNLKNPN